MFRPISQTHPAELMAAGLTCHMVTPLVLLNRTLALRTSFSICQNPRYIFRLRLVLFVPILQLTAIARPMTLFTTFKAEFFPAYALHILARHAHIFDNVVTAWVRAPLHSFIVIRIRSQEEPLISFKLLILEMLTPHGLRIS